jgi:hypothetical protein
VKDVNDLSRVIREGCWFVACVVAAVAFSHFAEDKYNQTAFVTACFYALTGVVRLGLWARRR